MQHLSQNVRVAIEEDNVSIKRIEERCIKCGQCAKVCNALVSVNNNYDLELTGKAVCVNCGQCAKACPCDAIVGVDEFEKVAEELKNKDKIVIISTSPSARVALGDEFGFEKGAFLEGKMVALLKKLGFTYVLDTNFAADLTICEEATELIERITKKNKPLPQFTSCCPAWIKFAETFYPEIRENISTCKSPIGMQGPIIKTYFAQKMGIDPNKIVNVALTPCVAKKAEIRREEMNASAKFNNVSGMRDMDYVITTVELARWARQEKINLKDLEDETFDDFMGQASGAGVIFGNTGGVMEAAVRTAYSYLTGNAPSELVLNLTPVRDLDGMRDAEIEIGDVKLKVAVIFGLSNARKLLEKIKAGEHYDFVEIMSCPGGCIGGGGQPKHLGEEQEAQRARIAALYARDKTLQCRASHLNPQIISLYKDFLQRPNSELAEKLLHTYYCDRSGDLNGKNEGVIQENNQDVSFIIGDQRFNYRVSAIVHNKGRILLHRAIEQGYWSMLGGRCKLGEDSETAIRRELKEELGLENIDVKLFHIFENFFEFKQKQVHEIMFVFDVELDDSFEITQKDNFPLLDKPTAIVKWMEFDKLEFLNCKPALIRQLVFENKNELHHDIIKD